MKRCRIWGELKPRSAFCRATSTRDGFRFGCRVGNLAGRAAKYRDNPRPTVERATQWRLANPDRHQVNQRAYAAAGKKQVSDRKSHLKRKYELTLEAFDELLASQGGGCAICGRTGVDNVEHDRETGRVRGILCFKCNVAIGLVDGDADRARAAAEYLERDDELAALARARLVARAG